MTSIVESLPNLREVPITIVPNIEHLPTLTIRTDTDVELWKQTTGYKDYALFLRRLNESVVGVTLPYDDSPSEIENFYNMEVLILLTRSGLLRLGSGDSAAQCLGRARRLDQRDTASKHSPTFW